MSWTPEKEQKLKEQRERRRKLREQKIKADEEQHEKALENMKIKEWEDIAHNGDFKNQQKLLEVRFIGVEFDYQKVDVGQRLLNEALAEGFQPLRDFDRGSGIVMVVAKWGKQNAKPKNKQK